MGNFVETGGMKMLLTNFTDGIFRERKKWKKLLSQKVVRGRDENEGGA